jgi:hypothetical protein
LGEKAASFSTLIPFLSRACLGKASFIDMSLNSNEETAVCLLAANSTCYYGMPSISADDPAFLVAGGTSGELPDSFIGSSEHNLIVLSAMMCH